MNRYKIKYLHFIYGIRMYDEATSFNNKNQQSNASNLTSKEVQHPTIQKAMRHLLKDQKIYNNQYG